MNEENLDELVVDSGAPDSSNYATAGQRFLTYLIDVVIYYLIAIIAGLAFGSMGGAAGALGSLVTMLSFFLYYILMEQRTGKTVGKMIMKTRVVNVDGGNITMGQAFIRTISRIVPFEFISVWIGDGVMWHDSWASTRVIKD